VLIGFALSTLAYRFRILRVPGGNFVERLDRHVHLTPAQRKQIGEIMEDTRGRIERLRRDYQRDRRDALWDSYDHVRAVLTPEQQQVFDREFVPPWGSRRESEGSSSPSGIPSPAAPQ
jgi:Spy/CpxP family protein refolding chaperone